MTIIKNSDRQYVLTAKVEFTYADLVSGVDESMINLPGGARVVGGRVGITTAFDSVTSDTITVGDGTTANRYASGANGQTLDLAAPVVPDASDNGVGESAVFLTWTQVGGGTSAGAGFLEVDYVIAGRGNETQPN